MQLWDPPKETTVETQLPEEFWRDVDACVLVFDVNGDDTFTALEKKTTSDVEACRERVANNMLAWRGMFFSQAHPAPADPSNFPFVVIGNKVDREERIIRQKNVLAWTQGIGDIPFFECSAMDSLNVDKAFECVARNALSYKEEKPKEEEPKEEESSNLLAWLLSSLAKK